MSKNSLKPLTELDTYCDKKRDDINVIIETPRENQNKLDYNPELGIFELASVMPQGSVFPYDFGFIPSTLGEDGDPLDVLVLLDQPVPTGTLVRARLIGVIEAEQSEEGKVLRNDRLLAVAIHAHTHEHVKSLDDLRPGLVKEIQHFFVSYNQLKGREFKPVGTHGPKRAHELLDGGV